MPSEREINRLAVHIQRSLIKDEGVFSSSCISDLLSLKRRRVGTCFLHPFGSAAGSIIFTSSPSSRLLLADSWHFPLKNKQHNWKGEKEYKIIIINNFVADNNGWDERNPASARLIINNPFKKEISYRFPSGYTAIINGLASTRFCFYMAPYKVSMLPRIYGSVGII